MAITELLVNRKAGPQQHFEFLDFWWTIDQIPISECCPFQTVLSLLSGTSQLYLFLLIYYPSLSTYKAKC